MWSKAEKKQLQRSNQPERSVQVTSSLICCLTVVCVFVYQPLSCGSWKWTLHFGEWGGFGQLLVPKEGRRAEPGAAQKKWNRCSFWRQIVLSSQTQFHLCHYATCHDEAEFVDAELFIPERWLRAEGRMARYYQHHPYSFIPFGVGVRACVGKRVAEMEMFFALSRVRNTRNTLWHFERGALFMFVLF